jgi:lipopolysaccharide/colanic/teichoic acid biosynthesis glycosyltransferase
MRGKGWQLSKRPYRAVKRLIDIAASTVALVFATPLFVVIAALIKLHDSGPVFFRQPRAGQHGQPFKMIKFRTMSVIDAGGDELDTSSWVAGVPDNFVFKTSNSGVQRITPIGQWLRRSSLDEIPQLINVFSGKMTLVGPRPEILPIVERYNAEQAMRLSVKPGLTGWAQVTGRSLHDHGQKMAADRYYVEHVSMRLDLQILFRTVRVALHGRDAF